MAIEINMDWEGGNTKFVEDKAGKTESYENFSLDPEERTCPVCGQSYRGIPAVSRRDNTTLICPDCGIREALDDTFGLSEEEKERILGRIHRHEENSTE